MGCPRLDSVAVGSLQRPRGGGESPGGGGESPGGGGVAGRARRGWRGPQLQSTCGSLALALRCWLHLVAACIQDADEITRFL